MPELFKYSLRILAQREWEGNERREEEMEGGTGTNSYIRGNREGEGKGPVGGEQEGSKEEVTG